MSRRPCDAVNVVDSPPAASPPCTAPAAPASLCIVVTSSLWPKQLTRPWADHVSTCSPIDVAGEMG